MSFPSEKEESLWLCIHVIIEVSYCLVLFCSPVIDRDSNQVLIEALPRDLKYNCEIRGEILVCLKLRDDKI